MCIGFQYYKKLPQLIQSVLKDGDELCTGISVDESRFDSNVTTWLINIAFDILKDNIIFPDEMSRHAFSYSLEFFIHTPVIMPDGKMWLKHTGVPSGSFFTSMIDSIVNRICITYAHLQCSNNTSPPMC